LISCDIMGNRYDRFKMKVRKTLPDSIRYRTVCRKCKKATKQNDRCITCQTEFAVSWGQAW
jgi:hypothetical protein